MSSRNYTKKTEDQDERSETPDLNAALERLAGMLDERSMSARLPVRTTEEREAPSVGGSTEEFLESATRAVLRALDERAERSVGSATKVSRAFIPPITIGIYIDTLKDLVRPTDSGGSTGSG